MHFAGGAQLATLLAGQAVGRVGGGERAKVAFSSSNAEIRAIHDDFLAAVGRFWCDSQEIDEGSLSGLAAAEARDRLSRVFARELEPASAWLLEDPRLCRLLPLWDPVLAGSRARIRFVLTVRPPGEVTPALQSLSESPSRDLAAVLWLRHVCDAEAATRGRERVWLTYAELMANPQAAAARACDGLWSRSSGAEVKASADESLGSAPEPASALAASANDPDSETASLLSSAWRGVELLANGREADGRELLEQVKESLRASSSLRARALTDGLRVRVRELTSLRSQAIATMGSALIDIAGTRQTASEPERKLSERERVEQLSRMNYDTQMKLHSTQLALHDAQASIAASQATVRQCHADLATLERQVAASEQDRRELQQRLTSVEALLAAVGKERDAIVRSKAWRVTAPLRALRRLLR